MNMQVFAARRNQLSQKLIKPSLVIIPGAKEIIRNGDAHYPFRQNSDFYYLTGFQEPDAIAVLVVDDNRCETILFNRTNDPKLEIWNGKRAGQIGAIKEFGADYSYPIAEFKDRILELLAQSKTLYYPFSCEDEFKLLISGAVNTIGKQHRSGIDAPQQINNIEPIIHEMRLIKSEQEITTMRQGISISAHAHKAAMVACRPGLKEYELEAVLINTFTKFGCRSPAYASIVAGGENACILHYTKNDELLNQGDLVLIDAGAEFEGYAADITRTFPVNGKFSESQRRIYELVLKAQLAVIEKIKPGTLWHELQDEAVRVLTHGLIELGLLTGHHEELIQQNAYLQFYMHSSGHWLGLDVHDVGSYKINQQWRPLEPGMVLTVEPGIYISPHHQVDEKWHGIGVRIEDDVLVTKEGNEVLSREVPKTINEIETLMYQQEMKA